MVKYIFEIRNRLFLITLAWFFSFIISYYYKEVLLFTIIKANIIRNSEMFYFIFTNVTEVFSTFLTIVSFISLHVFIWYVLYHLFVFLSPALFIFEHKHLEFFFMSFTLFSVISVFFSNYIIIPLTWNFFLSFKPLAFSSSVYFEARLSEYLEFYITIYCFCILYFQVFSIMFFFLRDVYSYNSFKKIKKFRKLYYYIFLICSTILSTPEVITQILFVTNFIMAYEIIVFFLMYFVHFHVLIRQ